MGCDGGTIPKRDELVRIKKKPEQVDRDAETVARWKHCAISQEQLKLPIVSCELGRLYNKDSVIEHLLDKSSSSRLVEHIRNLKDIVELKLTPNPSYRRNVAERGDDYCDWLTAEFICPVTGLEMNGKHRFGYNRSCGCVLSERSIKEIKSDACHKCGSAFLMEDVVNINGSDDEILLLRNKMDEKRQQAKLERKNKKDSRKKRLDQPSTSTAEGVDADAPQSKKKCQAPNEASTSGTSKAKRDQSSSSTADLNVRSVMMSEEKLRSTYSVAKDPASSEAFKSLFTTHHTHKKQERAHWITYNPLYN